MLSDNNMIKLEINRRIITGKSPHTWKLNDVHLNEPQVKRKSSERLAKI